MTRRRRRGLSLVEVVAAMALVACFYLAVASLEVLSYHGSRNLHLYATAEQVCGSRIAEVRGSLDRLPTPASGTTRMHGIDFAWALEVQDVSDPRVREGLKEVRVRCTWMEPTGRKELVRHTCVACPEVLNPPPSPSPSPPAGKNS